MRLLGFTILIPGTVGGYIPFRLLHNYSQRFELGNLKYSGAIFIILGIVFYSWTTLSFLLKGGGTPTVWFLKPLKFLLGEEPKNLVSEGLYRISRNPMYIGVISFILGRGIIAESPAICIYVSLLFVFLNVVIIFVEEPHLKKKYGQEYEDYLNDTSRWFSLFPRKT